MKLIIPGPVAEPEPIALFGIKCRSVYFYLLLVECLSIIVFFLTIVFMSVQAFLLLFAKEKNKRGKIIKKIKKSLIVLAGSVIVYVIIEIIDYFTNCYVNY